ncbi:putative N-acetyltransferase domain-containing protein [Seiridium cardinale]
MSISTSLPTPMLESDLETAAQFMYASQIQQATNRFVFLDWPNESAQLALYNASIRHMFEDPANEMYKITADSGEMIASLILSRKVPANGNQASAPSVNQRPIDTSAMNPAVRPAMRSALMSVQKPMEGDDHLVLSSIFVKQDIRTKGLGTQLVKLAKERAAAEGVPLFLSSVPSASDFYRKLGFKDTNYADIDLSLVVIGASVGGALGVMVGIRNNQASSAVFSTEASSSDPSATGSPSSSAITTSGTTSIITTTPDLAQTTDGSPASNMTSYAPLSPIDSNPTNQVYTKYCGFDTDGNTLMGAYVQNFDLCVNLCNNWNYFQSDSSTKCTSLAFLPGGSPPNNCWAKTGTKLVAVTGNDAALRS